MESGGGHLSPDLYKLFSKTGLLTDFLGNKPCAFGPASTDLLGENALPAAENM